MCVSCLLYEFDFIFSGELVCFINYEKCRLILLNDLYFVDVKKFDEVFFWFIGINNFFVCCC